MRSIAHDTYAFNATSSSPSQPKGKEKANEKIISRDQSHNSEQNRQKIVNNIDGTNKTPTVNAGVNENFIKIHLFRFFNINNLIHAMSQWRST